MVKKYTDTNKPNVSSFYSPVVAVLGHVDHGKTTLLDAIRKTNIAGKEFGGITQKIGASSIEFVSEGQKKKITFIDTPGHEAFMRMRGRGVQAGDMALLVVSSVDGVMPQTKESIKLLKATKIPFIVVLTKSDLPHKNIELAKQQLLKEEVLLEGYGGDVPIIEVSAKTKANIKELLELILLVFELKKNTLSVLSKSELKAIVIESKLDPKSGPRATVVIKSGSIFLRDELQINDSLGRVRSIINDKGERLERATIGDAVEILGFDKVPEVGSVVVKKENLVRVARGHTSTFPPASAPSTGSVRAVGSPSSRVTPRSLSDPPPTPATPLPDSSPKETPLSIVLCADTLGSLEAIINALPKGVLIVSQKTGEVTPSDILFAKSVGAIVIGFNLKVKSAVVKLAGVEKVLFKNYNLIYELIDEITDALEGKQLKIEEKIFGKAKVLAIFPYEKTKVAGILVSEGRVAKGDKARLARKDKVIGESNISSLRIGKNPISKADKGQEAGAILAPFLDFEVGDVLICHG